jgi:hypothetical protein
MEWNVLDPAAVNFVQLSMLLGENYFFNRVFGKCQIKRSEELKK